MQEVLARRQAALAAQRGLQERIATASMGPTAAAAARAAALKGSPKPYVVAQRYVDNPLLINGRKFGIRLWAVVTGEGEASRADGRPAGLAPELKNDSNHSLETKSFVNLQ